MNQRQLASVLFATLGVFLAVCQIPHIFGLISMMAEWSGATRGASTESLPEFGLVIALVGSLLVVIVGALMAVFRERLAERLFPMETPALVSPEGQAVGFSILGCYFIVEGVAALADSFYRPGFDWSGAAQLVLGAVLFLGGHGLAALWLRLRGPAN